MRSRRVCFGRFAVRAALQFTVSLAFMAATLCQSPRLTAADNDKSAANSPKDGEATDSKTAPAKTAEKSTADENRTNPTDPKAPLKRLLPGYDVWIDVKNKQVVIDGEVCLTRGLLEMFACLRGSKEHESVVSVNTKAYVVHAALLAMRAKEGSPAKWEPKYQPARGTEIEIMVFWTDDKGQSRKAKAQDWVRDIKTQKPLAFPWVFAGSAFHKDEMTGKSHYLADASGDFICVSNFPSALLDLPVESSQANSDLAFEAFTENIPPRGTKVQLVLMPKLEKKDTKSDRRDAETQTKEPTTDEKSK
jgi:hypothetical protein